MVLIRKIVLPHKFHLIISIYSIQNRIYEMHRFLYTFRSQNLIFQYQYNIIRILMYMFIPQSFISINVLYPKIQCEMM
jgi:hypothetical protein